MLAIIKDTAAQIGDKIDVKREIETILAAKQYEFRVMSAVPYVIIGYMNVKFPGIYGHFIWKSGRNRGDDGMFADLCGRVLSWIKDHKDRSLILVLAGLMLAGGSDPSGGRIMPAPGRPLQTESGEIPTERAQGERSLTWRWKIPGSGSRWR